MEPSYLKQWSSGTLQKKSEFAWRLLTSCTLCPRKCRIDRLGGQVGFCGQGPKAKVARAVPHYGEEPPISGSRGAGTVFFSGCALRCLFCQNYQISQEGLGEGLEVEDLSRLFLELQDQGCHNLDLVSPTPHLPFILKALEIAIPRGLRIPLVYNTHGYLLKETLDLLEGVVDIYLPDMKYGEGPASDRLSRVADYAHYNQAAMEQIFRQVGPLKTDAQGVALRGLLVRHLVLPAGQSDSLQFLQWLSTLSLRVPVSLMAQYRPGYKADQAPEINRPLQPEEYGEVLALAEDLGFEEIFIQELDSALVYNPDFTRRDPFS